MFASWGLKQHSACCDNEEDVIVAMTSCKEIKHSQQCRNLGYSPSDYVCLLDQLYTLLFYSEIDQFGFDYKRDQCCRYADDD